jgi:hypothetical protein
MTTLVAKPSRVKIWKSIPGYEGLYEVSNFGEVRSIDRIIEYPNNKLFRYFKGKILKQSLQVKRRYYGVRLSKQGKTKLWLIHQLVALAFLGPKGIDMVVCHGPEGSLINTPENLSYGTYSKNNLDQWRDKTKPHGELCSWSKLKTKEVFEIQALHKNGVKNKDLALRFNVSPSRICDIIKGRGWNHLNHDNSCS